MNEDTNENLFVTTYIKRHESVFLEHLRKQLEAETRSTLLEMAVNEQNKQIEELNNTVQSLQDTVEQALNGVKAASIEKDKASSNMLSLERELQGLRQLYNEKNIICNKLENELHETKYKLEVTISDNNTLKNNYSMVLKALEEQTPVTTVAKRNTKKKTQKTEDKEWVDAD